MFIWESPRTNSRRNTKVTNSFSRLIIVYYTCFHPRLISEITPGKKGGEFELPFGGKLTVPSGVFQKKDVVTCCQVSPSNRYKYLPPLKYLFIHSLIFFNFLAHQFQCSRVYKITFWKFTLGKIYLSVHRFAWHRKRFIQA